MSHATQDAVIPQIDEKLRIRGRMIRPSFGKLRYTEGSIALTSLAAVGRLLRASSALAQIRGEVMSVGGKTLGVERDDKNAT